MYHINTGNGSACGREAVFCCDPGEFFKKAISEQCPACARYFADKRPAVENLTRTIELVREAGAALVLASSNSDWLKSLQLLIRAQGEIMRAQAEIGKVVEARS